ncbi:hypothetical protein BCR44DRAFT_1534106 [Catenaria anguillulae PL171]|uniref:Uncharacterized protein n=1 Tax=Catenaria anguillulae PL171 TaxID=765915 RepID=A0A1Y2HGT0_9FUNG|nr:hypothetical protein BCR44DRAFT_1534106 [Catenaria anguillulae PL171]
MDTFNLHLSGILDACHSPRALATCYATIHFFAESNWIMSATQMQMVLVTVYGRDVPDARETLVGYAIVDVPMFVPTAANSSNWLTRRSPEALGITALFGHQGRNRQARQVEWNGQVGTGYAFEDLEQFGYEFGP